MLLDVLNRETWTKGCYARDSNGQGLECITDPRAVKWCLLGALYKHYSEPHLGPLLLAAGVPFVRELVRWNDAPERTWEEVEAVIHKAGI